VKKGVRVGRVLLVIGLLPQGLAAQEYQAPQGAAAAAAQGGEYAKHDPEAVASIPFELIDNLVVVEANINGRAQRSVLDSGASVIVVDQFFSQDLGLSEQQSIGEVAGAGAQAQQLRPVEISSLMVGPLRLAHVPSYSVNLEHLTASAGFPIALLLGSPVFKDGAVSVDYVRRQVSFGPTGSLGECEDPIPMAIVHDVPMVEVQLKPTPESEPVHLKLIVDLGTRHRAMVIGGPFVRSPVGRALMQTAAMQKVGHGTGGKVEGSVARMAEVMLGSSRVTDLEVALTPGVAAFESGAFDGSLGVPLWKNGVITFDYPAQVLCITPH
jgi:hypothetical protein